MLPGWLARHNRRFAVPAADPEPGWLPWPAGPPVEAVFCFHYPRRVAPDATLSWDGRALALPPRTDGRSWAGTGVTVQERLDGSLWVSHQGLDYRLLEAPPAAVMLRARHLRLDPLADLVAASPPKPRDRIPSAATVGPGNHDPNHPWRRYAAPRPRR